MPPVRTRSHSTTMARYRDYVYVACGIKAYLGNKTKRKTSLHFHMKNGHIGTILFHTHFTKGAVCCVVVVPERDSMVQAVFL